jgi:hypothetical protein
MTKHDKSRFKFRFSINNIHPCVVFFAAACLFLFILSGCQRQESGPYKIVDSEIWPSTAVSRNTFWLDNERILSVSNKSLMPDGGPDVMVIWNPDTGKVDFSHQLTGLICVQDGQVFFAGKDAATGKRKYYRGPIDSPQEYPPPDTNISIDYLFDCAWTPKTDRSKAPYLIKLKDDNYIEITEERLGAPVNSQGKTSYYERLDLPPVQLPVYTHIEGSHSIRFNQLRNSYFIGTRLYKPNDPYYNSMWWLSRDGHLTTVPFPKKIIWPSQGSIDIYPLRDGYLAHYNGGKTSVTDPGARGLYLIKGESMEKVLLGSISHVSISSDGCRAAFIYARNRKEEISRKKPYCTIKTINFCEGRKEQ